VIIAAERGQLSLKEILDPTDDLAIAAITAAELIHGALGSDGRHRAARMAYVERVVGRVPIEDYDLDVARAHAELLDVTRRSGRPRGAHDLIIAATAAVRNRVVLTTDTSGFIDLPGVDVRIV
jgi:tRNA(fMet)-specific endonuclease VapC